MRTPGFTGEASVYQSTQRYSMAFFVDPGRGNRPVSIAAAKICYVWGEGPDQTYCFNDPSDDWNRQPFGGGGGSRPGGGGGHVCHAHWDPCDNGYQDFIGADCDIQYSRPC